MAADAAAILRRLEQLKSRRAVVETEIRDCYRYTDPARGIGFESPGAVMVDGGISSFSTTAEKKPDLMTSVGTDGARIQASAIMSGATPANTIWFELNKEGATDGDKRWLEESAKTLWQNIHASNYDAVGFDCMYDLCIAGQFALFVDEAEGGGLEFEQWELAHTYFAASKKGRPIDTVINEFPLTAEQAIAEYGEDKVSDKIRKTFAEKPDEQFTFVRAVYPRRGSNGLLAKNMPIASCHVEKDTKHIVRESGYHEMPIGVPRWKLMPGSHYALGPVYDALPDLKVLNTVISDVLANMDLAIAGMWIAEDDGVINARNIKIGPRKIIVANSVDSMKALEPATKFDAAALEVDRLERQIRKMLMSDQLSPDHEGPAMTATEISVRVELIRQLLGPVYGRMQSEFLQWLVLRCFGIAYRAGVFGPAPESLRGTMYNVRYIGPLARAQRSVEVAAMDRYENTLATEAAATGRGEILDNYDWDEAARMRQDLLGVPQKLKVDKDLVKQIREQRKQDQQQQQAMQMTADMMQGSAKTQGPV